MKIKDFKIKPQLLIVFVLLFFVIAFSAYNYIKAVASPVVQFTADVIVSLSGISDGSLYIASGSEAGGVDIAGPNLSVTAIPDANTFLLKTSQHNNGLRIVPSGGTPNLSFDSGDISSGNITQWTISKTGNYNIDYLVGVDSANGWYNVKVNNDLYQTIQANSSGELSFHHSRSGTNVFSLVSVATPSGGLIPSYSDPPSSPSPTIANPEGEFNVIVIEPTEDVLSDEIPSVIIEEVTNRIITLRLFAGPDTKRMIISEDPEFKNADQVPYERIVKWILSEGDGLKTIYVKFFTEYGVPSPTVSVEVNLKTIPGEDNVIIIPGEGEAGEDDVNEEESSISGKHPIKIYGPGVTKKKIKHVAGDFDFYTGISSTFYALWAEEITQTVKFVMITSKAFLSTILDFIAYGVAKIIPDSWEDKLFNPKETEPLRISLQPQVCNPEFYKGLSKTFVSCIAERTVQVIKHRCKIIKEKIILIFDYIISGISKIVPDSWENKLFNSEKKKNLKVKLQPKICNAELYQGLSKAFASCIAERTVQVSKKSFRRVSVKTVILFDYSISGISKIVPDQWEDKLFTADKKRGTFLVKMKQVFKDSFSL